MSGTTSERLRVLAGASFTSAEAVPAARGTSYRLRIQTQSNPYSGPIQAQRTATGDRVDAEMQGMVLQFARDLRNACANTIRTGRR